jgi:copper(I)-binding protein
MKSIREIGKSRKLRRFREKVVSAVIFLAISYAVSLVSFLIYSYLTNILAPIINGFGEFFIIGLAAGAVSLMVALLHKRFVVTVVLSFVIDCLVESIFLYAKSGIRVIEYIPGLLLGMTIFAGAGFILNKRSDIFKKNILPLNKLKEKELKKYALARKLLEKPDKITIEILREACELLQGIDPRMDKILREVNNLTRGLTGDMAGFIVAHIKTGKEENEEKKEKVLLVIDLVNDIKEELDSAFTHIGVSETKQYLDHPLKQTSQSFLAGPAVNVSTSFAVAVIATSTVIAVSPPKTKPIQDLILPTQIMLPTVIPTAIPTVLPTDIPGLIFKAVEKTFYVPATALGTNYTVNESGTYRFTITGGAMEITPQKAQPNHPEDWGWKTTTFIYRNKPIEFSSIQIGMGYPLVGYFYQVGAPNLLPTAGEAEKMGQGRYIDLDLKQGEYLVFVANDSNGGFADNNGGVTIQVQKGVLTNEETTPAVTKTGLTVDSGWAHFWRSFNGPPGPGVASTIDYSGMAMYVTVHNYSETGDRITGGASGACASISFDDMSISGPDGTVSGIDIPAKSTVAMDFMKAGRIICNGAKAGLKQGDRVTINLMFEKSGPIPVWVEIKATPE